jgi:hypothetical protein
MQVHQMGLVPCSLLDGPTKPETRKWQASDSALDWWSKITNMVDILREAIRSLTLLINMRDTEGKKWDPRGTTAIEWLPPASSRCSTLQHSSQFHHLTDLCTRISGIFAPPAYHKNHPDHKAPTLLPKFLKYDCPNTPVINSKRKMNYPLHKESILLMYEKLNS